MTVIIGIDPHKATHVAVAIDGDEEAIARVEVNADRAQTQRLLAWAAPLGPERTWAIESADGLGKLLSQQLLAAGEHVVDVPPTLAARVRLLGSTKAAKNDGNDALATAIAGLRHCELRVVRGDDDSTVLRLLVGRYDDLVALRTKAACRLHAMLRELVAGGAPRRLSADRAAKVLRSVRPDGPVEGERKRLAAELLADVRRLDRELVAIKTRIREAVDTSATTLLELNGVGPIVAALILAHVGDPTRFPTPERFASYNGTAPIEASTRRAGPRRDGRAPARAAARRRPRRSGSADRIGRRAGQDQRGPQPPARHRGRLRPGTAARGAPHRLGAYRWSVHLPRGTRGGAVVDGGSRPLSRTERIVPSR
jgi:transposase